MPKLITCFVLLVILSLLTPLAQCGTRGGGGGSRSGSSSSFRSGSYSSFSYRSSSYYSYRSYSYSYYYYYYNYYDSIGVQAPPPPPFCTAAVSPLGATKVNVSSSVCFPTSLPPSVDYLTPYTDFGTAVDSWTMKYLALTINYPNTTQDIQTLFFDSCRDAIQTAVCASYYIDCVDTTQKPCTSACTVMKTCRESVFYKALNTTFKGLDVKTDFWIEDCMAYPVCLSDDNFCCWGLSADGVALNVGVVVMVVALLVNLW